MSEPNDTTTVKTRTRFPFVRRRWLVLACIVIVMFAIFAWGWSRAHRQHMAVKEIERLGGYVEYVERNYGRLPRLGIFHFKGILTAVDFGRSEIIDSDLETLQYSTTLERVYMANCGITDSGLEHVVGLKHLVRLELTNTPITDEGLKHLQGLTALRTLNLIGTQISDKGLEHLKGLTNLEYLSLDGTKVTKKGVEALQKALPNCKTSY